MFNLLLFILSTIGLTLIITQSYLFRPFREKMNNINTKLGKLFNCCQCMGFWCGMIIETLLLVYNQELSYLSLIIILLFGFIGSFVSYLTYLLMKPLTNKYD